jgi:PPM family protein phosphatase
MARYQASSRSNMFTTTVDAHTNVGSTRKNNEDAIAHSAENGIAVLADGMGGHNAGEVASQQTTQALMEGLVGYLRAHKVSPEPEEAQRFLKALIASQNKTLYALANSNLAYEGMGCTLVVAWLLDNQALIANVGDSRCYHLSHGVLKQITRDHSFLQFQLDHELISLEEARSGKTKNYLLRAMGTAEKIAPDFFLIDLQAGDVLLTCTDGLTEAFNNQQLLEKIAEALHAPLPSQELVKYAIDAGSRDNISVQLIHIDGKDAFNEVPAKQTDDEKIPNRLRKWIGSKLARESKRSLQTLNIADEKQSVRNL